MNSAAAPQIAFREANPADLPWMVALLANDPLGSGREKAAADLPESYQAAFEAIEKDPRHQLLVLEREERAAAFLQLSFLPNLTYEGGWRAQIEGVRVEAGVRGEGLGRQLLQEAIRRARERGCRLVQLTTDKRRPDALRFYESLGFVSSHEGMKLPLEHSPSR